MIKIKSATRLAITIGFLSATLVWFALAIKLVPDQNRLQLEHRLSVARAIAVTVSCYAENRRYPELKWLLERNLALEPSLVSVGIRRTSTGKELLSVGPHAEVWKPTEKGQPREHQIAVDILANGRKWGQMEIVFRSRQEGLLGWLFGFPNGFIGFLTCGLTLLTWSVLSKSFKYLNPSKVVPDRVRSALDSIAGGLVLVANSGEIAHANKAFGGIVQREREDVLGTRLEEYAWCSSVDGPQELPWTRCHKTLDAISGEIVEAKMASGVTQKYMVNATPIFGSKDQPRGALVSFEDVTALESKKAELAKIIQTVRLSRDEVERQNEQLNFLASYDPLTKCMNRRAFFGHYEKMWAEDAERQLTVIMMDIDHFKSVNDNHGHSVGDQVLTKVGEIVTEVVGRKGVVCRYGGEEFVVLLPDSEFEKNCELAEELRLAIQQDEIAGLTITTSLGISTAKLGAMDPQHMLDQADQCLYVAKRSGRNRLTRFDKCPTNSEEESSDESEVDSELVCKINARPEEIEYSSVTGLLSALSFRSPAAAEHSVRVADLAVAIGQTLMSQSELYKLEIASLLHEVGKIGIADLTQDQTVRLNDVEMEELQRQDTVGLAILRSAFASEEVMQTISRHHERKAGQTNNETDKGLDSMASRILRVCDSFDSMVNPLTNRRPVTIEVALAEMVNRSPVQFDPIVMNKLVEFVAEGRYAKMSQPRQLANRNVKLAGGNGEQELDVSELDRLLELAADVVDLCRPTSGTPVANPCHQ